MISENELQQLKDLLALWQEKRAFLEKERVIIASPEITFQLDKRIEECYKNINDIKQKIQEGTLPTDWKNTYALPPEICKNEKELLSYLDFVLPNLRENFGFLDIKPNIYNGDQKFNFVARKQSFDMSIGWLNYRGEAYFIFAEFYQLTIDSLREFSSQCLKYTEEQAELDTLIFKPLYDFRLPNSLCASIALVDELDENTRQKILTENPLRHSVNALWYQIPVVYELKSKKLYFYEKPKDWIDEFTGEIAWKELRKIIKKTLLP
ncbi:MAG: hypothetical protein QNJ37_00485 [Crocosphaera sp.]|nr:hypothetical protein [Crocosphaera sp.]